MTEKYAETLYLLHKSSEQLLNTMYAISKDGEVLGLVPEFLEKKSLDPLFKKIIKKFPISSDFMAKANCAELIKIRDEVSKSCKPFYDAFTSLYNFKETFYQITCKISNKILPDLMSHAHLSIILVEIMVTLIKAILMMNLIANRYVIIGCYGIAVQSIQNTQENEYINVSKFITDYIDPYFKLGEEFGHLNNAFDMILSCFVDEFRMCSLDGKQMEDTCYYNLVANPRNLGVPNHNHIPEIQLYGYLTYSSWYIYISLIFPMFLMNATLESVILLILSMNVIIPIHRDTFMFPHKEISVLIENNKTLSKKTKDINEAYQNAIASFLTFHKDRRDYFASTIHQTYLLVQDSPGLLGPKFDQILKILSLVYESVYYWCLHFNSEIYKAKKPTELIDSQLFIIIYDMIKLKNIIIRYSNVIQRYYASFISNYDFEALEYIKTINGQNEADIDTTDAKFVEGFSNLCQKLKSSQWDDDWKNSDMFLAMRLDWLRMQVRSATGNRNLCNHSDSCCYINNLCFHTKAIDSIEDIVHQCAPMYNFWFFSHVFQTFLTEYINVPGKVRYISVIIGIFADFNSYKDKVSPIEFYPLAHRCFFHVDEKLMVLAKSCGEAFTTLLQTYKDVNKSQNINTAVTLWLMRYVENKKDLANKLRLQMPDFPGSETQLILKEESPEFSNNFFILQEFCETLSQFKFIQIIDHYFYPKMTVVPILESTIKTEILNFAKLVDVQIEKGTIKCPKQPSILSPFIDNLQQLIAEMGSHLDANLDCLLYSCLLSMNTPKELSTTVGLAQMYATWFVDTFVELDFQSGYNIYSPVRRSFVSKSSALFRSEEFTDTNQLRALARIVGLHGVKTIVDSFNTFIANNLSTVKKYLTGFDATAFVTAVKSTTHLDSFYKKDKNVDEIISILIRVSVICAVKRLLLDALRWTIEEFSSNLNVVFQYCHSKHAPKDENMLRLLNSLGYDSDFDLDLVDILSTTVIVGEVDRSIWVEGFLYLLPYLVGYIALRDPCEYLPQLEAYSNNLHLVAEMVISLSPQILYNYRGKDVNCIEKGMRNLCEILCLVVVRIYNGTLASGVVEKNEEYFHLCNILSNNNRFIHCSIVEKIIPNALLVSVTDKILKKIQLIRIHKV